MMNLREPYLLDQSRSSYPEAIDSLQTVPALAGLDASSLDEIAQAAVLREFPAGQVVFLEGEPCAGLFIVKKGWLKAVRVSLDGREQVIRFMRPGDLFNEVSFLTNGRNQVTIESLEPSRLWCIQPERFKALLDDNPKICRLILDILAQRVLHLMSLIEDLSLRSVRERLARVLLENAVDNVASRRSWSTQAEMAAHMGTVPDVLHRVMRGLVEEGLIQVERTQITILDPARMREIAMIVD